MNKLFLSLATVASFAAAAPAIAQDRPASVAISYADLDLSRAHDVTVLQQRINAAVAQVCGAPRPGNTAAEDRYQECRTATLATVRTVEAQAVAQATARINLAAR